MQDINLRKIFAATAFFLGTLTVHCHANSEEVSASPWFIRVGPAAVELHIEAKPEAPPGTVVPGALLTANNGSTLGVDIGYSVNDRWAGHLTLGVPLKTKVQGEGTLAAIGKVGELTYGPAVLSATYRLGDWGGVRPYVGAGLTYLIAFSSRDAGLSNFEVDNAWGSALTAGVDIDLNKQYSLFFDVKKTYLKTKVRGNVPALGGVPAYAKVTVNPVVFQVGVGYRF